ncbi:MAG: UdgX family uracil-DNA binding protein [Phycisphaerales bacterium]|nr:UdgX family uracil-DNA binding protein [Phycisphaerales bacterium]
MECLDHAPQLADPEGCYDTFLKIAAYLIEQSTPPGGVDWQDSVTGLPSLFPSTLSQSVLDERLDDSQLRSVLGRSGELASCHSDYHRWTLLYKIAWRTQNGERALMGDILDPDVRELDRLAHTVRRDIHKMKAFVRFKRLQDDNQERYIAWHRPDHRILRLAAPFFARRFGSMRWTIFTEHESVSYEEGSLVFGKGIPASDVDNVDEIEELWKAYYRSIFNPARIKINAMVKEMPRRYWSTLPEADIIQQLLDEAPSRVRKMIEAQTHGEGAAAFLPDDPVSLPVLQEHAEHCAGCGIAEMATRTVFGEGPQKAPIMLIGEQPGDEEDRVGRPFVGPAGQVLNRALEAAGLDRSELYITNAVKHFKYEPRGNQRVHRRASAREIRACSHWLNAEIAQVQPEVIVLLGAAAGQSLFGAGYRVGAHRGQTIDHQRVASKIVPTIHPSMVLRSTDSDRSSVFQDLVNDLRHAAEILGARDLQDELG